MEELLEIFQKTEEFNQNLRALGQGYLEELRAKLWCNKVQSAGTATASAAPAVAKDLPVPTPQQTKKRPKRLSSLRECGETSLLESELKEGQRKSTRASNEQLLAVAEEIGKAAEQEAVPTPAPRMLVNGESEKQLTTSEKELMPPPPAALKATSSTESEVSFARPQRAAKLKSERNLKEPKLNQKMRRPSNMDKPKVKLEHEHRPSQMNLTATVVSRESSKSSMASVRSEDSSVMVVQKAPSIVEIPSEDETVVKERSRQNSLENEGKTRSLRVKVKREKLSVVSQEPRPSEIGGVVAEPEEELPEVECAIAAGAAVAANIAIVPITQLEVPLPKVVIKSEASTVDSTISSSTLSTTMSNTAVGKKGRKKKDAVPKPIKVERFSDLDAPPASSNAPPELDTLPVAARTRNRSNSQCENVTDAQRSSQDVARRSGGSVYEDAMDQPVSKNATISMPTVKPNATIVLGGAPNDATFCANAAQNTFVVDPLNPNSTVTIEKLPAGMMQDATFNVAANAGNEEVQNSIMSQSMATARENDSLITEDESYEQKPPAPPVQALPKPGKVYKMPTRTNELFNPLIQSPVKKKVEAFENAAAQQVQLTKSGRPKRTKENTAPASSTTPVIGKLPVPTLGRFLTPTQSSNLTPSTLAQPKKAPNSASKAMAFPKTATIKASASTTGKPLSRENSAEDFRKGLHQLAEERKKQREQKHQLAAQQREAKERERAERMAKLAKEREEKRLKKQQETEQKKRELEEISRKLRAQEEAAAAESAKAKASAKAKTIAEQERQMLAQMKVPAKMMPPPAKLQTKYTFEMLHEDDSTDDEDKTSYKRPPPPTWSRSHVRGACILMQQSFPTAVIDSFFSVEPMSPDLRVIFPDIDQRMLKRNSSVLWSTPPRYSELPKY